MRYDGAAANFERLMAAAADRASHALGRMLNAEVRVSHCLLYHGDGRQALMESLQGLGTLVTFNQTAFGAEAVEVSMLIEESRIRCLLDLLLGRHGASLPPSVDSDPQDGARFDPLEIDALKETANILTGTCIGVLGRDFGLSRFSMPSMGAEMPLADRVCALLPHAHSMCVKSGLRACAHPLEIVLVTAVAGPADAARLRTDAEQPSANRRAASPGSTLGRSPGTQLTSATHPK